MFRCDEISSEAYKAFSESLKPISDELHRGNLVADFGPRTQALLEAAMGACLLHLFSVFASSLLFL